jgi:8-oxo-dGTP diphosphatase
MSNLSIRIRVAALLIEEKKILFIAHKKDNFVYWLLPGGGVNPGESLEEALKREIKEELDIDIKVNDVALICDSIAPDESKHIVNICFFCTYNAGTYFLNKEQRLYDFGFFNADEIKNLLILPPIKAELENILLGFENTIYHGKKWVKQ